MSNLKPALIPLQKFNLKRDVTEPLLSVFAAPSVSWCPLSTLQFIHYGFCSLGAVTSLGCGIYMIRYTLTSGLNDSAHLAP